MLAAASAEAERCRGACPHAQNLEHCGWGQPPLHLSRDQRTAAAITANLIAPIVFNPATRCARQIVLPDSGVPLRFPVFAGLQQIEESIESMQVAVELPLETRPAHAA